jgi:hypothetical protein
MSPPKGQPLPASDEFCAAHEHLDQTLRKLDGKMDEVGEHLTKIRIALSRVEEVDERVVKVGEQVTDLRVELAHYDESNRGAWKEIKELRDKLDKKRDRDDEPTGVRETRDREDDSRDRKRDREDRTRDWISISPNGNGAVFKIPVPKVIVWLAIAVGMAIAAGGWAWGVLRDQAGSQGATERPAVRAPLALPLPRSAAVHVQPLQQ